MKCVICNERKAKRFCPAKNDLICAQCCGEKRVLEIDCPESCEYLKSGRQHEMADYARRLNRQDEAAVEKNQRIIREHQDVVGRLEYILGLERLSSHDLSDRDVLETVDLLLKTYQTESKGILYEKMSDNLRIEPLRQQLRTVIESFRNPEGEKAKGIVDPQNTRLQLGAAIECLEFIRSMVLAYMEDRNSETGYVDFLARITPREPSRGSILMP
jgi:hypothetical protein